MKGIYINITLILLLLPSCLFAQFGGQKPLINLETFDEQRVHWGYYLGFNYYDFKFEYREDLGDVLVENNVGFNVGLIGDLRVNEFVNLRFEPGLFFNRRDLYFPNPSLTTEGERTRQVNSTYIHLPLLLKISTRRLDNIRPFVIGGASFSTNLASEENSLEDNSDGTFRMTNSTFYYEMGFGIDFYLYYFKFSPSIRGIFAITDELTPDNDPSSPWTSNIAGMFTRGFFINFTFE